METVIEIKEQKDFSQLFSFCQSCDLSTEDSILVIDIAEKAFLNTCEVLMIVQCIFYIHKKVPSLSIIISSESSSITHQYIQEIGLFEFCKTNHTQPTTIEFIESQTSMPIRRIDRSNLEEYVMLTLNYIGNYCSDKDLTVLSLGLKESINNVYDHACSEIGAYVFCQYYPKMNTIRVCVSDMGVGIPANVKKIKLPNIDSDQDCILWATKAKNTTRTLPSNAGVGLANIVNFIKQTNSKMTILSDAGRLQVFGEITKATSNPINNFIGTLIEFDIKVDNLNPKEEDYLEDVTF